MGDRRTVYIFATLEIAAEGGRGGGRTIGDRILKQVKT
jgi:hypothetical protein